MYTVGSINFGNIPVANGTAPIAYSASQGVILNGVDFQLGAEDFSSVINTQRSIVFDGVGSILELRTLGDTGIFTFGNDAGGNPLSSFFISDGITFSTFRFNATDFSIDTPNSAYDFIVNANSTPGLFAIRWDRVTIIENNTDSLGSGGTYINLKVFDDGGFNGFNFQNQLGNFVALNYSSVGGQGASIAISGLGVGDSALQYYYDLSAGNYAYSGIDHLTGGGDFVMRDYSGAQDFLKYSFVTKGIDLLSGGGDINMTIGGAQVLRATASGLIAFNGTGVNTNYLNSSGGTFIVNGGTQFRISVNNAEKVRYGVSVVSYIAPVGIGSNSSGSISAWLSLEPSNGSVGHMLLRAGAVPSAPTDGLVWFDGTNLFMRVGGVTKTFTLV